MSVGTGFVIKVLTQSYFTGWMREMTDLQGLAGQIDAGVLAWRGLGDRV